MKIGPDGNIVYEDDDLELLYTQDADNPDEDREYGLMGLPAGEPCFDDDDENPID